MPGHLMEEWSLFCLLLCNLQTNSGSLQEERPPGGFCPRQKPDDVSSVSVTDEAKAITDCASFPFGAYKT